MNTKTKTTTTISPALAARYRMEQPSISGSLAGLDGFLTHRALMVAVGDSAACATVEKAWWEDALLLAAMPAANPTEAQGKLEALQAATDDRAADSVADMIAVGMGAERCRWQLDSGSEADGGRSDWPTLEQIMNGAGIAVVSVAPWQASLYDTLRRPLTRQAAYKIVLCVATHRTELRAIDAAAAAAGAAVLYRNAVIKLASVEATRVADLVRKAGTLGEHRVAWADDALVAAMVEAAVAADMAALAPSPRQRARIDRLMGRMVQ